MNEAFNIGLQAIVAGALAAVLMVLVVMGAP
jgi:hypothetical protein